MSYIKNLVPTEDNVTESYKHDSVGRKNLVHDFILMLDEIPGNSSVAISGEWGSGKTFFVKQVKLVLDKNNTILNGTADPDYKMDLKNNFLTLYFDAWLHDNDEEPLASLITLLTEAAGHEDNEYNKEKVKKAIDMGISILNMFLPKNAATAMDILKAAGDTGAFFSLDKDSFRPEEEKTADMIQDFYDAIIPEHADRLVVFIDELDRCKPDFAVRFLERIKHYLLLDDRVIFVFSINREQLEQTIKHFYGYGFDSHRYLDRFFDFTPRFGEADVDKFCSFIDAEKHPAIYDTYSGYYKYLIEHFHMTMREITSYLNITKKLFEANRLDESDVIYDKTKQCVIYIYAPILCAAEITSPDKYNALISGKGSDIIRDIGKNYYFPKFSLLWKEGETTNSRKKDKTFVSLTDKYVELYEAVFMFPTDKRSVNIGKFIIRNDTKDFLLNAVNSLGVIR